MKDKRKNTIFVISNVDLSNQNAQRVHLLEVWSRIALKVKRVILFARNNTIDNKVKSDTSFEIRNIPYLNIKKVKIDRLSYQASLFAAIA